MTLEGLSLGLAAVRFWTRSNSNEIAQLNRLQDFD